MKRCDFSLIQPGDRLLVVNEFTPNCYPNHDDFMDRYLGKVVTAMDHLDDGWYIHIYEDEGRFYWNRHCFVGQCNDKQFRELHCDEEKLKSFLFMQ